MATAVYNFEPFVQGDLDGLCGLYASVNGFNNVRGVDLSPDDLQGTFKSGLQYLDKVNKGGAIRAITTGINGVTLQKLLPFLADRLSRTTEYAFRVESMRNRISTLKGTWETLEAYTSRGSVIVMAVSGDKCHWTCVTHVTPRRLWCCDSDGLQWLNQSQCTLQEMHGRRINELNPYDMFAISRVTGRETR